VGNDDAFLTLARGIVEASYPDELPFFDIDGAQVIAQLEARGAPRAEEVAAQLEDQESGLSVLTDTLKYLPVLLATYKTILDLREHRRKRAERRLAEEEREREARTKFGTRLAEAKVAPEIASKLEAQYAGGLARFVDSEFDRRR